MQTPALSGLLHASERHFVALVHARQPPHTARPIFSRSEHASANQSFMSLVSQWHGDAAVSAPTLARAADRNNVALPAPCSSSQLVDKWWSA